MSLLSNTGLLASVKHEVHRKKQEERIDLVFDNISGPAPYVLRPFAGLYNPFPYGCSILCNHPADFEAKDVVRRAKETWATEGKPILLPEELNALRINALNKQQQDDGDEMVPEELFRRYTETDSRPITPAPTLASVMTHGSTVKGGRRCFTPDPVPSHNNQTCERPLLVLDLRRTQSQETLSWHGGPGGPVPTTVLLPPTRSPTPSSGTGGTSNKRSRKTIPIKKSPSDNKSENHDNDSGNKLQQQVMKTLPAPLLSEGRTEKKEEEEIQRRRGRQRKKNKKHSRDLSSGLEKEFKGLPEPGETQVSAFDNESRVGSARPSLSVTGADGGSLTPQSRGSLSARGGESNTQFGSSYLDTEVLKLLSRELDKEIIDNEFDLKRRIALEEAMRIFPPESRPPPSEEINKLKKELCIPSTNTELWLSLPRTFSRQSARFELPLDMDMFSCMTPLEYIKNHVDITSGRRMLYNLVFNRHNENLEEENVERNLPGEKIILALGEMMGRPMTEEEGEKFQNLVGWKNEDKMDFRTWCGLCALCERILGPEFCSQILSHEQDPRHEIEKADFDTLPRRLLNTNPDPRLVTILKSIRDT